jgi:hypothetical protein
MKKTKMKRKKKKKKNDPLDQFPDLRSRMGTKVIQ